MKHFYNQHLRSFDTLTPRRGNEMIYLRAAETRQEGTRRLVIRRHLFESRAATKSVNQSLPVTQRVGGAGCLDCCSFMSRLLSEK